MNQRVKNEIIEREYQIELELERKEQARQAQLMRELESKKE